jgi:alpha-L-rhamnosidase
MMRQPEERRSDASDQEGAVAISGVRVEHRRDALGIGTPRPRLSWMIHTTAANWWQDSYEIAAFDADGELRAQTGRIRSAESVLVPWPFAPLRSRERQLLRVRVWGRDGAVTAWSDAQPVEAGLMHPDDWSARFVTPSWEEDPSRPQPYPMLRRAFAVHGEGRVVQARLYITALGVYEAYLNGVRVGDQVLAPGWTSYGQRLRYQTYDVTDLLRAGPNVIGAVLGDGWYRGRLGFDGGQRNVYGDQLGLLAQLEISYSDGVFARVVTDMGWRAAPGPILASDLYDGEWYDARLERPGWAAPGYDDRDWSGTRLVDHDLATLVAPDGPPVRPIELVAPVAIGASPSRKTIVDFGQNLVGRVRVTVRGRAGETITLRHAEVLEQGELCTRPLRQAAATDRYTLRGEGVEVWEPRFTFHGFRYVEVEGWPGDLPADAVRAVVCHSDLERTGWFACSDPLINRLHENVVWSMRGNFLEIPADCPQRDERLGWTGDIQVFAPTACFLYDVAGFLRSWLQDLAAEQDPSGAVPHVVPKVTTGPFPPAAGWGDAAVIVPWVLYHRFGDAGILAAQWDSMRAWVDRLAELAGPRRLWDRGFQFGDWVDPSAPPERPGESRTDPYLVATAYFARSADLLGQAAGVLGRPEDHARYQALAVAVRVAFAEEYLAPSGRLVSDSATAYALAIEFALLPTPDQRRRAGEQLVGLVRENGHRISTGFLGTPLICDALCSVGAQDTAYRLLTQRACPSWLYPVTMGATTIWERWDSLRPDGTVNPGEMTSFNHYALGAIADWLHRVVAGLAPAAPGYRRLLIRPCSGGGLRLARAAHRTPYGMASVQWQVEEGRFDLRVSVPPNTSACVVLPGGDAEPIEVGSGTYHWSCALPVPVRAPLTLDSRLVDLIGDAEAWEAVLGAAPALGGLEVGLRGRGEMPLQEALSLLPDARALRAVLERELTRLQAQWDEDRPREVQALTSPVPKLARDQCGAL